MRVVIKYAKLTGSYTVNGLFGVYCVGTVTHILQTGPVEFGGVADLERNGIRGGLSEESREWTTSGNQAMKVLELKVLFVGSMRVVTLTDIKDSLLHVLLNDKPGAAAEAESVALADGMEP